MRLVRVALGDAQDLEVGALLVAHLEHADRAGPDVAAGERRLVDDQQRVGVVAVVRPRPLDEAVVEVVEDGRRQHAIEPEDARRASSNSYLFRLPARDLDDDLDPLGKRPARAHAETIARRFVTRYGDSDRQSALRPSAQARELKAVTSAADCERRLRAEELREFA